MNRYTGVNWSTTITCPVLVMDIPGLMSIAGEYLSSMNRCEPSKPMSDKWFYNFLKRWPELSVVKPSC